MRRPAAIPLTRAALSRASTDDIADAAASAGGRSPRPTMLGGGAIPGSGGGIDATFGGIDATRSNAPPAAADGRTLLRESPDMLAARPPSGTGAPRESPASSSGGIDAAGAAA